MNPLTLRARNYRTFAELDVDVPTGCVAVTGPNGAGKSSILNAIDVALFADRGELNDLLTVGETDLELQLTFEHGGELYRVRRQMRAGKSPTLDLERQSLIDVHGVPDAPSLEWEPLTLANAAATQERLNEILGLSRATFRASSFLRQGDGAAFTEASPRDRKAILAEIIGLDVWDKLLDEARKDIRDCDRDLAAHRATADAAAQVAARRPEVERELAERKAALDGAAATLARLEGELEHAIAEHAKAAAAGETIRACQAEVDAAVAARDQALALFAAAQRAADQLPDATIELGELGADADRIPELERTLEQLRAQAAAVSDACRRRETLEAEASQRELARDRLMGESLNLHEKLRVLNAKVEQVEAAGEHAQSCDRCGQTLGAEAAARAAESWRQEGVEIAEKVSTIDHACEDELAAIAGLREQAAAIEIPADPGDVIGDAERQLRAARSAAEQRATLAEKVRQLTEQAANRDQLEVSLHTATETVTAKQQALEAARAGVVDERELEQRVATYRSAVVSGRGTVDYCRGDVARLDASLAQIAEAEQQQTAATAECALAQKRLDVLKVAERAYGRDGIPALIVENAAIPQIETEANRILDELGTPYRVQLRTQRELKSGDGLKETLDIVVSDGMFERGYETFSGGERTRLNLALRIALARLLTHRRGAESRLLAIDEPEFLDEAGVNRLAEVLRGLAGDFDRILLVSHHPTLAGSFDETIEISKSGDRSQIAGVREAVAA